MRIDATITIVLRDSLDQPVAYYPRADLWLETVDGGLVGWPQGTTASRQSGGDGESNWWGSLAAGGSGIGTVVVVGGVPLSDQVLDIRHNSPDLNGDGLVDLRDWGCVVADARGGYAYRSDFYWDEQLNVSDLVLMADAFGCCGEPDPPTVPPEPNANGIGVFFDAAGTVRQASAPHGVLTVYLVASHLQTPYLAGFEVEVTAEPEDGMIFMSARGSWSWNLTPNWTEFCVGYGAPLDAGAPTLLLESIDYYVTDSGPHTFKVGPITHCRPSIPGAACFLGGSGTDVCDFELVPFQPPAGAWDLPCAGLNGGEIRGVEERTWGGVKAAYR